VFFSFADAETRQRLVGRERNASTANHEEAAEVEAKPPSAQFAELRRGIDQRSGENDQAVCEVEFRCGDFHRARSGASRGDDTSGGKKIVRVQENVSAASDGGVGAQQAVVENDEGRVDENVAAVVAGFG
jgi:hypothetical protein